MFLHHLQYYYYIITYYQLLIAWQDTKMRCC